MSLQAHISAFSFRRGIAVNKTSYSGIRTIRRKLFTLLPI